MSERLNRKVRRANLTERLYPADRVLHDQGLYTAIDPAGRPVKEVFRPILPPQVLVWGPSESGYHPVVRPGLATMILARSETAPTTGDAMFEVYWESASTGYTYLSAVGITLGNRFGEAQVIDPATGLPGWPLPAGAWVKRNLTDAEGATIVSIALVIEPR